MFRSFTRIARLYLIWLAIFSFTYAFPATLMNFYLEALGFDRAFIGIFHASSQVGGLILALPALMLFELLGRRISLVFGMAFSTLIRIPTVTATSPEVILLAEALSGFGTVIFGLASVSLLADASTADHRAALFGSGDFVRTTTVLLGSILAGGSPAWIASLFDFGSGSAESYRLVLVVSFILRMAAVIPLAAIARFRPTADDPTGGLPDVRALRYLNPRVLLGQRPHIYALAAPFTLLLVAESLVFTFFNLLMRDRFGASDAQIGVVIGVNALIGSVMALLAPRVAERIGYRPAIVGGALATAVSLAALALSPNLWIGVSAVFAQVAVSQVTRVLYRVYVVNVSARPDYFIVSTMMAIATNAGPAVGPPVSGLIQRTFGYGPLFVLAVVVTTLAALLFAFVARRINLRPADERLASAHDQRVVWPRQPSPQMPVE